MSELWLLTPVNKRRTAPGARADAWRDDCARSFVVRAPTELEARGYAAANAGDEGAASWLSSEYTTCEALTGEGSTGVIVRDYYEP